MNQRIGFVVLMSLMVSGQSLVAKTAYTINGTSFSEDDVYKGNEGRFYELEKQKYDLIEAIAKEAYLESYFQEMAKQKNTSIDAARAAHLDKAVRVTESEIKENLERYKDNTQLQAMSETERRQRITEFLQRSKTQNEMESIVQQGLDSKKLDIVYPRPSEPIFDLQLFDTDHVKYGPKLTDTKPLGCSDDCAITIVEYSEYQCPFCVKVLATAEKLMGEYKGKIRWIVRDFPLGFHNRAKPAAVAARCAGEQGKYWEMYTHLFENQKKLADEDLTKYGSDLKLDTKKYQDCLANPDKQLKIIDKNFASGEKVGVTGTPAFFINGRRMSGAQPYEEFKRIIDDELQKKTKS